MTPPRPTAPHSTLRVANSVLFFLMELATYATAAWWGFVYPDTLPVSALFGFGTPILLVLAWTRFGSPKAKQPLSGHGRTALLVLWFGTGVLFLLLLGHPLLTAAFAVLAATTGVLERIWGLYHPEPRPGSPRTGRTPEG